MKTRLWKRWNYLNRDYINREVDASHELTEGNYLLKKTYGEGTEQAQCLGSEL